MKKLLKSIRQRIKNQINEYRKAKFIRKGKTKARTVISSILYVLSIISLAPSLIHIMLDTFFHLIPASLSIFFFNLSEVAR